MALYRAELKRISRTDGASAVAAASYRLGARMKDDRTGELHNYTRKGGIEATGTLLPQDAPDWDAERLWNEAEKKERRVDSLVAKEFECAIPRELNKEQRRELVENFTREEITSRGLAASYGIHQTKASDGDWNPHVHILMSTRQLHADGFDAKKDQFIAPTSGAKKGGKYVCDDALETFRQRWEDHTNEALAAAGSPERVDCRSYEDRGIDKKPAEHLGKDAWNMEKKGVRTELGNHNRNVAFENRVHQFIQTPEAGEPAYGPPSANGVEESQAEWRMATGAVGTRKRRESGKTQDKRDMNRSSKTETVLSTAALTDGYTNKDYYERMDGLRDQAVQQHEQKNQDRDVKHQQTKRAFQEAVKSSRSKQKQREPELS